MEIKGKIEKIGFLTGQNNILLSTFNTLKEDIPKSIEKEGWTDMLPMGCRPEKIMQSEHFGQVEREIDICTVMSIKMK